MTVMKKAIEDVMNERVRQIVDEGFSPESDDVLYTREELALAAATYALPKENRNTYMNGALLWRLLFPWSHAWFKPSEDRRRDLVKAAALLIAAIEQIDRNEVDDNGTIQTPQTT